MTLFDMRLACNGVVWNMVQDRWHVVHDTWCLINVTGYAVNEILNVARDIRHMMMLASVYRRQRVMHDILLVTHAA